MMRFWFGRKSAPDARPFVPAWLNAGEQPAFARSYDAQFEEVFRRNPVGQRAVRLVAGMLGALPVYAMEGDERAAAIVCKDGLLESVAANLMLHGNAYAQLLIGDDEAPAEIALMRPERVSVVSDGEEPILCQVTGENMRPPAPVDLQAEPIAEGGLLLQWTRRCRAGWDWPSGSEPPLGENSERYRIALQWTGGSLDLTATEPRLEIAADTFSNVSGDLTITVVQIGDFAESRPASISITI